MKILLSVVGVAMLISTTVLADSVLFNSSQNQFYVAINGTSGGVAQEFYDLLVKAGAPYQQGIVGLRYYSGSFSASTLFLGKPMVNATITSPVALNVLSTQTDTVLFLTGDLGNQLATLLDKAGYGDKIHPAGLTQYFNGKSIRCNRGGLVKGGVSCNITVTK